MRAFFSPFTGQDFKAFIANDVGRIEYPFLQFGLKLHFGSEIWLGIEGLVGTPPLKLFGKYLPPPPPPSHPLPPPRTHINMDNRITYSWFALHPQRFKWQRQWRSCLCTQQKNVITSLLLLYNDMAAMTSHANQEYIYTYTQAYTHISELNAHKHNSRPIRIGSYELHIHT